VRLLSWSPVVPETISESEGFLGACSQTPLAGASLPMLHVRMYFDYACKSFKLLGAGSTEDCSLLACISIPDSCHCYCCHIPPLPTLHPLTFLTPITFTSSLSLPHFSHPLPPPHFPHNLTPHLSPHQRQWVSSLCWMRNASSRRPATTPTWKSCTRLTRESLPTTTSPSSSQGGNRPTLRLHTMLEP